MSYRTVNVVAPGYLARQDTKTPVRIGIISMLANVVFSFMLAPFYGYVGLAIATAMSATLNAYMLYRGLSQQGVYRLTKTTFVWVIKLLISNLIMLFTLLHFYRNWPVVIEGFSGLLVQLFGLIGLAVFTYFAVFTLLGFRLKQLKHSA